MDVGAEYVDEATGEIKSIADDLFEKLSNSIAAALTRGGPLINKRGEYANFTANKISHKSDLIELIAHLALRKIRIVLILDNLDQYHFQFKKWAFIDEYGITQDKSVRENIGGIVNKLETQLENPGLCVLLICRDYVYQHLRLVSNTLIPQLDSAVVYQIAPAKTEVVVETRQALYREAKSLVKINSKNMTEAFAAISELMNESGDIVHSPVFDMLKRLSHHGHRGLVEFLSLLKIHDQDGDVYRRFFIEQQTVLLILYINKQRKRYSQDSGHFPNIFLNDLHIRSDSAFPLAKAPHIHTYWLKYLILKYVCKHKRVGSLKLIKFFRKIGYEEVLIRVVLGSLSTSEFYCIQVDGESKARDRQKWLVPTERGIALTAANFSPIPSENDGEFCFSFVYLQLVVEDYLLALPSRLIRVIEPIGDYSYIYLRDHSYGQKAIAVIKNRAKAAIWFLKIITASLNSEVLPRMAADEELGELLPNLDAARSSLIEEIRRLGRAIGDKELLRDVSKEVDAFNSDVTELEKYFDDYHSKTISVS